MAGAPGIDLDAFQKSVQRWIANGICEVPEARYGLVEMRPFVLPGTQEDLLITTLQRCADTKECPWYERTAEVLWGKKWVEAQRPAAVPPLDRREALNGALQRYAVPADVVGIIVAYDGGGYMGVAMVLRERKAAELDILRRMSHRLEATLRDGCALNAVEDHAAVAHVQQSARFLSRWRTTMSLHGYVADCWFDDGFAYMRLELPSALPELVHK